MSDLHDESERGQRRTAVPVWIGLGALLIGALAVGTWYAALRSSGEGGTSNAPEPGPSASPERDRPAALPIALANGTDTEHLSEYVAALLRTLGRLVRDAGFEITDGSFPEAQVRTHRVTKIFSSPTLKGEARTIRHQLFPRAKLRPELPGQEGVLGVMVGEDFIREQQKDLEIFGSVRAFMDRRLDDSGAERFLSNEALAAFKRGEGGLSLYGYTANSDASYQVIGWGSTFAVVRIETDGSEGDRYEVLVPSVNAGEPVISEASVAPKSSLRYLGFNPNE